MAAAARVEVGVGDAVALLRAAGRASRSSRVAPSLATRPVISWPKIQPSSGYLSGASPRQKCRSEPQMLARETRMSTPSGSTSGIGTSRISNGLPGPKKTAALAVAGLRCSTRGTRAPAELERVVEGAHGELGVLVLDDAGDGDLRGRDHLDVDALLRERGEHAAPPRRRGCACPRRRSRPWPPGRRRRRPRRPISRAMSAQHALGALRGRRGAA